MSDKQQKRYFYLALGGALLFGASTPACKQLLAQVSPGVLAGLLYLGSGLGLSMLLVFNKFLIKHHNREAALTAADLPWLAGAIIFGGIAAPVCLMYGLASISAADGSLLLNLEGAFTAMIAWFVFKENFDRRIALGMFSILSGGICLAYQPGITFALSNGALAISLACLFWAIDNNFTRKISAADPLQTSAVKGFVAGIVNLSFALTLENKLPGPAFLFVACLIGFLSYGLSLSLYIKSLRHLGAARTGACFATAPFIGAAFSISLLQEPVTQHFLIAGVLMALGVWLHITEKHIHEHTHEEMEHEHMHIHDEHHHHEHDSSIPLTEPHSHRHRHSRLTHIHQHFPDLHHEHKH